MTNDEWYERERAAFIAWWESEGQEKFGTTPTMAAGAGWLAKAERVRPEDVPHEAAKRVSAAMDILESASPTGGKGPLFSYRGTELTYQDVRALANFCLPQNEK